eukprot:4050179-Pyramimonas_sp.AAC.2
MLYAFRLSQSGLRLEARGSPHLLRPVLLITRLGARTVLRLVSIEFTHLDCDSIRKTRVDLERFGQPIRNASLFWLCGSLLYQRRQGRT